MNITKLASEIAKEEGLKVETSVGNVREILSLLSDKIFTEYRLCGGSVEISKLLFKNGERRWRKSRKK